jgi:hypothetical protein
MPPYFIEARTIRQALLADRRPLPAGSLHRRHLPALRQPPTHQAATNATTDGALVLRSRRTSWFARSALSVTRPTSAGSVDDAPPLPEARRSRGPSCAIWLATRRDWPPLVQSIARKWLDEGLQDRCITRDLEWGVPVPKPGFEDKVFYVVVRRDPDRATSRPASNGANTMRDGWQSDDVRYLQFLANDNVPFHAISFPATLLGSGLPFRLVDVIKGFNWLAFEGGDSSTSARRGIFTDTVSLEACPCRSTPGAGG